MAMSGGDVGPLLGADGPTRGLSIAEARHLPPVPGVLLHASSSFQASIPPGSIFQGLNFQSIVLMRALCDVKVSQNIPLHQLLQQHEKHPALAATHPPIDKGTPC